MSEHSGDEVVYVNNPIEAGLPGHWVPLSVIKKVIEMRAYPAADVTTPYKIKLKHLTNHIRSSKTPAKVNYTKNNYKSIKTDKTSTKSTQTTLFKVVNTTPLVKFNFTEKNMKTNEYRPNNDNKATTKENDVKHETTEVENKQKKYVSSESTVDINIHKSTVKHTVPTTLAPSTILVTLASTKNEKKLLTETLENTPKTASTLAEMTSTTTVSISTELPITIITLTDTTKLLSSSTISIVSTFSPSTLGTTKSTTKMADSADSSTGDPFY
ncbi:protein let-653-like [Battus philenor]|uniref:protein let-653-like n=1 Tax=Battus philenor TaxID=42288 RepID=UPI0035CF2AE6